MCTLRTCPRYLKGAPNLAICVKKIKVISQKHRTEIKKVKGRENPRFFPLPGPHATIQSKMMRIVFDKKKFSNEHARPSEHFSNSYTVPKGNPYVLQSQRKLISYLKNTISHVHYLEIRKFFSARIYCILLNFFTQHRNPPPPTQQHSLRI